MTLTPLPATDVIAVNVSPSEHVMVCSRAAPKVIDLPPPSLRLIVKGSSLYGW